MANDVTQGGAPTGVAPTGESTQPQVNGAAVDLSKIDLTQLPQFRNYQAQRDREKAAADAELRRMQAQVEEIRRAQASQGLANLEKLDPEERADAYKQQLQAMQAEQARQAERNRLIASANQILSQAGLTPSDPRLADIVSHDLSAETLATLASRTVQILAADREAATLAAQKAQEDARTKMLAEQAAQTQAAKVQALNDAGVTATSNAGQVIAPSSDKDKKIASLRQRLYGLRGKGIDNPNYMRFVRDMRDAGVAWSDLGF